MHVPWPRVWKLWRWVSAQFFGTIVLMKQLCSFSPCSLPTKLCMSHRPVFAHRLTSLGRTVFGAIPLMKFVLKTHANSSRFSLYRYAALPKLFPTVSPPSTMSTLPSRSLPTELSPSYFPWFPVRPPCPRFSVAPPLAKQTKREPKHRRCFWKKEHHWPKKINRSTIYKNIQWFAQPLSSFCFFCLAEIGKCESKGHGASRNAWHATWHATSRNARRIGWEVDLWERLVNGNISSWYKDI